MVISFHSCLVCGEDVASFPDDILAMCADHSDADKLKALARLERAIAEKRKAISERN